MRPVTRERFLRRLRVWVCLPLVLAFVNIPAMAQAPLQVDYGTIEAIEIYRASDNQPINVGTVRGGIAGGAIGHQIGSGRGNTAATIAGAIGGAVAGNEIEKKQVQGSSVPDYGAAGFRELAHRRRQARRQPACGRPGATRE